MVSAEEIEVAKKANDLAEKMLPLLEAEMEELRRRMDWHVKNRDQYHLLTGEKREPLVVASPFNLLPAEKRSRAPRGEARSHIFAVLERQPHLNGNEVQEEVSAQFNVEYPFSTIYRNMDAFKKEKKSKEAAEATSQDNSQF